MHIHILGICGTFMGGVAQIARAAGHTVTGSDQNVYPPMSTQLESLGIELTQGYDIPQFDPEPDIVIVGNVMSRGNPAIEDLLNRGLHYISGPQWLYEHVLRDKWVLAVSGTHGKTTTSSMLAWILEAAGLQPGFLIGGIPGNFHISARYSESPFFVIEADEYDTAFFDKRSKFVHYHPRTLIINNLEYDHADIFEDLNAIKKQFHHLLRIVPAEGLVVANQADTNVSDLLSMGCWTDVQSFEDHVSESSVAEWSVANVQNGGCQFEVVHKGKTIGTVNWGMLGRHNIQNALAALIAARHVGVEPSISIEALSLFKGVKRRMEVRGEIAGITVYDDFAHHPTAIETTLKGLRAKVGDQRIIAILEPRSNTMKMGVHDHALLPALQEADDVWLFKPADLALNLEPIDDVKPNIRESVDAIAEEVPKLLKAGDHVLIMSNGGFEGLHVKLLNNIQQLHGSAG